MFVLKFRVELAAIDSQFHHEWPAILRGGFRQGGSGQCLQGYGCKAMGIWGRQLKRQGAHTR